MIFQGELMGLIANLLVLHLDLHDFHANGRGSDVHWV